MPMPVARSGMPIPLARLPSMDLIRSFVVVGRRMSITLAAEELCVTQSAVSRQVLTLEQALGVKLLVRSHRAISLTPEGERLFKVADEAVRQVEEAVETVLAASGRRPVTVSAPVGFAALWLVPRMGDLQRRHPGLELRISANKQIVELRREGIDLAIRYCPLGGGRDIYESLFGETIALVAAPSLRADPLTHPDQLADYVLIEFDEARGSHLQWNAWLRSAGWTGARPKGVLRFNQYDQVIQAALSGQGIAVGRPEVIGNLLADGRLVLLTPPRPSDADYAHWLVQAEAKPRKDVRDMVSWLQEQSAPAGTYRPDAIFPA